MHLDEDDVRPLFLVRVHDSRFTRDFDEVFRSEKIPMIDQGAEAAGNQGFDWCVAARDYLEPDRAKDYVLFSRPAALAEDRPLKLEFTVGCRTLRSKE